MVATDTPAAMEIHRRWCDLARSLPPKMQTQASKTAAVNEYG